MKRFLFAMIPLCLGSSCSPNVIVELSELPADVHTLRIDATLDGVPFSTVETARLERFALTLPTSASGTLEVRMVGVGKVGSGQNDCTIAQGVARADGVRSSSYYATQLTIPIQSTVPSLCNCGKTKYAFQNVAEAMQKAPTQAYRGVWGSSEKNVTFFGADTSYLRWTAPSTWTYLPGASGSNLFLDAHGDSAGNLWAANGSADVVHFDGRTWKSVKTGIDANSVWTGGKDNVWVGGQACKVQRYDGQVWKDVPVPSNCTGDLERVFGLGDTVWAFGKVVIPVPDRTPEPPRRPVLRCTQSGCVYEDMERIINLNAAWGDSLDNFWAASSSGAIFKYDPQNRMWNAASVPANSDVRDLWGSGKNDVWAVGGSGTILHFDGSVWAVHGQSRTVTDKNLFSIFGYGCDLFAGGESGTVLRYTAVESRSSLLRTFCMLHLARCVPAFASVGGAFTVFWGHRKGWPPVAVRCTIKACTHYNRYLSRNWVSTAIKSMRTRC